MGGGLLRQILQGAADGPRGALGRGGARASRWRLEPLVRGDGRHVPRRGALHLPGAGARLSLRSRRTARVAVACLRTVGVGQEIVRFTTSPAQATDLAATGWYGPRILEQSRRRSPVHT